MREHCHRGNHMIGHNSVRPYPDCEIDSFSCDVEFLCEEGRLEKKGEGGRERKKERKTQLITTYGSITAQHGQKAIRTQNRDSPKAGLVTAKHQTRLDTVDTMIPCALHSTHYLPLGQYLSFVLASLYI